MSQVMYQLPDEIADKMAISDCPQKSKKQRMQDYQEANSVVGPKKIQEMEQMMRDKLQQRTKTGPFQLRKTFKYFDRDGSGGIDFDEFQRAMEMMGFAFTDLQQLALFARYDESGSGEVDYGEFVEKVVSRCQLLHCKMTLDLYLTFVSLLSIPNRWKMTFRPYRVVVGRHYLH